MIFKSKKKDLAHGEKVIINDHPVTCYNGNVKNEKRFGQG